jgi:hypothetical protein
MEDRKMAEMKRHFPVFHFSVSHFPVSLFSANLV